MCWRIWSDTAWIGWLPLACPYVIGTLWLRIFRPLVATRPNRYLPGCSNNGAQKSAFEAVGKDTEMTIKHVLLGTIGASLIAAPVLAGSPTPAPVEPAISTPVAVPLTGDWTGGYVGGQIGYGKIGGGASGDDAIGGLTMGYDYDFGTWVLGAGIDYDWSNIEAGGNKLENMARLKLRAGYDLGQGLLYATAGAVRADIETLGSDDGYFAGIGYEHMLTQNISLGGEVLYHDFGDFNGSGTDVDATTAQIRATFRF